MTPIRLIILHHDRTSLSRVGHAGFALLDRQRGPAVRAGCPEGNMQIDKLETRHGINKRSNGRHPAFARVPGRKADVAGFQRALQALGTAYARVAALLDGALERSDASLAQLSALGANYTWISERRCLVKTFLDSDPVVIAYAHSDCPRPDQIRSLAETATELASEDGTLTAALGLLNYIDLELGWAEGEGRLAVA